MKRVLLTIFLLLLPLAAVPSASAIKYLSEIRMDARGLKMPEDAVLPVYSAPDEKAYRGADGKACVSLREGVLVLASTKDQTWKLIEYEVSEGEKRMGWIRTAQDAPEVTWPDIYEWQEWDERWSYEEPEDGSITLLFSRPGKVVRDTDLTDDPRGGKRKLRSLKAGEFVGIFFGENFEKEAKYRYLFDNSYIEDTEWTYVITTVDGKKACGFVPSDAVDWQDPVHMEGSTLVFEEGIEYLGSFTDMLDAGGIDYRDGGPVRAKAEFGMVDADLYPSEGPEIYGVSKWTDIKRVQLPSTLRLMGDDALQYLKLDELVIPEGTEYIKGMAAFFNMNIGTLVLPSTLREFEYCSRWSTIGRYEVDSRNPVLKSVDGVLYSKDGKTLISYPNGKASLHYDVPKGTEEIHAYAFYAYPYYLTGEDPLPLTSLSLPMGLKRIGAFALDGLENLVSLTIPPTVVEIGPYAFGEMISLAQLSMPERLRGAVDKELLTELKRKQGNGDNGNLVEKE